MRDSRRAAVFVAAATIAAFLPVLGNGWVGGWDDGPFLLGNVFYRGLGPAQLRWMFTTFLGDHYQPLTWMSFGADYLLWGLNPAGYHATSLALHAVAAVLYFFLARRLLRSAGGSELEAAFAALLFSMHPLRVEAVAWAADRRDVLAGLFFLAALLAYARAGEEPRRRGAWLTASCAAFALSLLSKAVALALPAALLIWDWNPGRRLATQAGRRAALIEKIPFAALSIAAGLGLRAAMSSALRPLGSTVTLERAAQAAYGLAFYPGKTIFPTGLSPLYELPARLDPFAPLWLLCASLAVLLTVLVYRLRRKTPGLLAAWLFYALMIFPMLGLATASYTLAADRYSYIACMPWPLLAAVLLKRARVRFGREAVAAAACLLLILGSLTWRQSLTWRDPLSLWSHAAEVAPDSSIARLNLGDALATQGRFEEAAANLSAAVAINPACVAAQKRLASGGVDAAEASKLRSVLMANPVCLEAYGDLVTLRASRGEDMDGAEAFFVSLLDWGLRRPGLESNLALVRAAKMARKAR